MGSEEAKEYGNILAEYVSKCSTVVEYGTRGGQCASVIVGVLKQFHRNSKWQPRFVGVDLVTDPSIEAITKLSKENGVSFQFWQGHTTQYPLHETDALVWDTFHAGGALFNDLDRISPYIHKYIVIMGVQSFDTTSEAVTKGFDISIVARELQVSEDDAKMGMRAGITKFLAKNTDWFIVRDFGEMCVLGRKKPISNGLFSTT